MPASALILGAAPGFYLKRLRLQGVITCCSGFPVLLEGNGRKYSVDLLREKIIFSGLGSIER